MIIDTSREEGHVKVRSVQVPVNDVHDSHARCKSLPDFVASWLQVGCKLVASWLQVGCKLGVKNAKIGKPRR